MLHHNPIITLIDQHIQHLLDIQQGKKSADQRLITVHPYGVADFQVVFYNEDAKNVPMSSVREFSLAANNERDEAFGLPVAMPMWEGDRLTDPAYANPDIQYAYQLSDILASCVKELQEDSSDKELWLRTFCLVLSQIVEDNTEGSFMDADGFLIATHFRNRFMAFKGAEQLEFNAYGECPKQAFDALMGYLRGDASYYAESDLYLVAVMGEQRLTPETFVGALCQYDGEESLQSVGFMMPVDIFNGSYINETKHDFISLTEIINDIQERGANDNFWTALAVIIDAAMESEHEENIDIWQGEPLDIEEIDDYFEQHRTAKPVRPYRR